LAAVGIHFATSPRFKIRESRYKLKITGPIMMSVVSVE